MRDHRARLWLFSTLAAATALGIPSCTGGSHSPVGLSHQCSLNSDCNSPLVCVFSLCHIACIKSSDCTVGERCVPSGADAGDNHVCQLPAESTCTAVTCPGGEACGSDGQCRAPCQTTASCISGQTCVVNAVANACYDPHSPADVTVLLDASASSTPDALGPPAEAEAAPGEPVTLATGQANPLGVAVDGANLYWTTDQGVMVESLTGGAPSTLASSPGGNNLVRSDGANVYWTSHTQGTVSRVAVGGGTIVTLASQQKQPQGITLDANTVYFTSAGGAFSVPKQGGTVSQIGGYSDNGIVSDGTKVYWVDSADGYVSSLAGQLASNQNTPIDITVDALDLYWTNEHGAASVMKLPLSGGGQPVSIATSQLSPEGIATDGTSVYWANAGCPGGGCVGAGSIAKVAVAGGAVVTVAPGQSGPSSLALDGTYVYWANTADGTVKKALK